MPLMMLDPGGPDAMPDMPSLPVAVCDGCGLPIENVAAGNYHWGTYDDDGTQAVLSNIYFSHKQCAHLVDAKFGTPSCMNLDDLLLLLIRTLKYKHGRAWNTRLIMQAIEP